MTIRFFQTITPLLWRVIVFLLLFVIVSGTTGPRIIGGGIVFRDGFAIYGGLGKAAIFGLIIFLLLIRRNKTLLTLKPWKPVLLLWMVAAGAVFAAVWMSISALLAGQRNFYHLVTSHAGLFVCILCIAIGCMGFYNIRSLAQVYRRELLGSIISAIAFYIFSLGIYALWRPLAAIVLTLVNGLLRMIDLHAIVVPPNTLMFDKFGITISEYCSGIESISLFTSLYAIVGVLDWKRLNKRRYFMVFPFALLALSLLNVLRVFGLILAGYYINPEIAFSLFHTYAGLLFFIFYSIVFWAVAYKHLIQKDSSPSKPKT